MAHLRRKYISGWLKEILEEQTPEGMPKNKAIAKRLVDVALNPNTKDKDFIYVVSEIIDRLEGKAVNTNINADVATNPFEGIDTAKLEALKKKIEEMSK